MNRMKEDGIEMKQKALVLILMTARCQFELGKYQQGEKKVGRSEKYLEGGTNRIQLSSDVEHKTKGQVKMIFKFLL